MRWRWDRASLPMRVLAVVVSCVVGILLFGGRWGGKLYRAGAFTRHSSFVNDCPTNLPMGPGPKHVHTQTLCERLWARSSWGWQRPRGSMRLFLQLLLQRPGSVIIRGTICRPGLACPVPCGARATPIGQNEMTRRELHISLNISLDMPNLHLPPSR